MVNIVPRKELSLSSATDAENCAESAMTEIPHTSPMAMVRAGGPPKVAPISSAQQPLMIMERDVTAVLPQRSARHPPPNAPSAPEAMMNNVTRLGLRLGTCDSLAARKLADTNYPSQSHRA